MGRQLMITSDVENYPAIRRRPRAGDDAGPCGGKPSASARSFTDDVTKVDFSERPFRVWVGDEEYRAETVIVATGANARQLGLESERKLQGRGVSYCAVCDAAFFKDRDIVVVGGGDSAMATFLAVRDQGHGRAQADVFRASLIMVDRAKANDRIEFVLDSVVDEVVGDDAVTGVVVRNLKTEERTEIPADGFFGDRHTTRTRPSSTVKSTWTTPATSSRRASDRDEHPRRLRCGRCPGSHLPPGRHGRRIRLYGRTRRGAVPHRAGRASRRRASGTT